MLSATSPGSGIHKSGVPVLSWPLMGFPISAEVAFSARITLVKLRWHDVDFGPCCVWIARRDRSQSKV